MSASRLAPAKMRRNVEQRIASPPYGPGFLAEQNPTPFCTTEWLFFQRILVTMSDKQNGRGRRAIATALAALFLLGAGRLASAPPSQPAARAGRAAENVILITLDGVRTEEIFGGLDLDVLRSTTRRGTAVEQTRAYERYWAETPEARRERLMPFFWGTMATKHGSIAGNRARGSSVRVTNRHRFSYPGYAEILVGQAHDEAIDSNDKRRNPFPTVLEFLKE